MVSKSRSQLHVLSYTEFHTRGLLRGMTARSTLCFLTEDSARDWLRGVAKNYRLGDLPYLVVHSEIHGDSASCPANYGGGNVFTRSTMMTKREFMRVVKSSKYVTQALQRGDKAAARQAFAEMLDAFARDGLITQKQASEWTYPQSWD